MQRVCCTIKYIIWSLLALVIYSHVWRCKWWYYVRVCFKVEYSNAEFNKKTCSISITILYWANKESMRNSIFICKRYKTGVETGKGCFALIKRGCLNTPGSNQLRIIINGNMLGTSKGMVSVIGALPVQRHLFGCVIIYSDLFCSLATFGWEIYMTDDDRAAKVEFFFIILGQISVFFKKWYRIENIA